jgi:hypothetical protein
MPEKIAPKQMRRWLQMYEDGKPVDVIAKKYHRDTRTIKRGIEEAKRDRLAESVRGNIMMEAAQRHQTVLVETVNDVMDELEADTNKPEIPGEDTDDLSQVALRAESSPYWGLLKQHLPRDPLWDLIIKWKKAHVDFTDSCAAVRKITSDLLVETCRCEIVNADTDVDTKPPFLYSRSAELIYAEAMAKAMDGKPKTDIAASLKADRKSGNVMSGGTVMAVAPGREEEFAGYIHEVLGKVNDSDEATAVYYKHSALKQAYDKARGAAQDIVLLGMVPGLCRICRKLGL